MKNKNLWRIYLFVITISTIVAICAGIIFLHSADVKNNTLDNLITFVVTILSMLIAILAYHISIKTYVSIDAVNAISRMDGNVMENENYRTNIIAIIRCFNAQDKEGTCEQIIEYLENLFKDNTINSGAKLADSIQEMIDIIVIFPFVIKHKKEYVNIYDDVIYKIEHIITKIEQKISDFEQLSEGSCILLRESLKLLKAVYTYQCHKAGYQKSSEILLLLDVRGPMLKNAISKTIYYNYMGLMYMNKAITTISHYLNKIYHQIYNDILSIDVTPHIKEMPNSHEKDLAIMYLTEAECNFNMALQTIRDELMWNAFIQYNKARVQYLLSLLGMANNHSWEKTMQTAISYRSKLVILLNDILGKNKNSYLLQAFSDQLKMAQLMLIRLKIANGMNIDREQKLPDIGNDEFLRLRNIHDDILKHTR